MTLKEYFQLKVELLSKKAKTIIVANDISIETIATYNFSDCQALKKCGTKIKIELTNLQKDICFAIDHPTIPLVLINKDVRMEYPLSFRAMRVLSSVCKYDAVALYNIVVNKSKCNGKIQNFGAKTFSELCDFYRYLEKKYSNLSRETKIDSISCNIKHVNQNQHKAKIPSLNTLCNEYNVSTKARKALSAANILNTRSLLIATKDPYLDFFSYQGVGNKINAELHLFFDAISKDKSELYEIVFSGNEAPLLRKYIFVASKDLNKTLDLFFNEQLQLLPIQQKKTILLFYKSFFDVIAKNITHCTEYELKLLSQFRENFTKKTEKFYDMTEKELWVHNTLEKIPYLNEEEKHFVHTFALRENRFPMFFLLFQSLKYGNRRSIYIFSAMIGLWYEDSITHTEKFMDYSAGKNYDNIEKGQSREQLGEKLHLPILRVREIYEKFCQSNYVVSLPFVDKNSWDAYPFLKSNYFSIDDVNFDNLILTEHLPNDFSFFCYLCALIRKDFAVLRIARNREGLLSNISSTGRGVIESILYPELYSYVYSAEMSVFSFIGLIMYIEKEAKRTTMYDKILVLSDLCLETRFWDNGIVNVNLISQIVLFGEKIIQDILHIQLVDGAIHIKANKVNVTQFLYDYILQKGRPVTVDELFSAITSKYPDTNYTKKEQIRGFLLDKKFFLPMGRKSLYTLVGTNEYCGCLPDLVIHILTASDKPLTRQEIFQEAQQLRPDSVYSSIRTTISTLLRNKKLVQLEQGFITLSKNNKI